MRYWIFEFHEDFDKQWRGETPLQKELKLRNNFYSKNKDGILIRPYTKEEEQELEKIKIEQKNYNRCRDEYTADRVFNEIGYEEFLEEISYSKLKLPDYLPCMSADK